MTRRVAMMLYKNQASGSAHPATRRGGLLGTGASSQFSGRLSELYGSNNKCKKRYGYHKRSLSETAIYRVKQLLGGKLSLRIYNDQVGETYVMIKALNKLTRLGMLETQYIV